jgi:O-antigen/teichoic acid export membrane protein
MILARLLAPDDFGLMAIVLTASVLLQALSDVGVRQSVIQNKRGLEYEYLNMAWWLQAVRGLALFVMGFVLAPLISSFYGMPELTLLLRIACIAVIFNGVISPRTHVMEKQLRFGRWVFIVHGAGALGTVIALAFALYIRNVWALVIGFIAEAMSYCLLSFIVCPFRPKFRIYRSSLGELLRYARGMLGVSLLAIVVLQTDIIVLGKVISAGQLGLYSLAVNLAYLPAILSDRIIRPVLLAGFSKKQDDKDALCQAILKISQVATILGMSLVAFMASCASGILLLAYGPKYVAVAVPFAVLCVCALMRIQRAVFVPVYMALGRPHLHRRFTALQAAIVVCLMYPAVLIFDLPGAAGVILVSNIITLCFQVLYMNKLIGLRLLEYVRCWLPGLLACSIVLGSVALLRVFNIRSVLCNVTLAGLSCVAACGLALVSMKYNGQIISGSGRNSEKFRPVSYE